MRVKRDRLFGWKIKDAELASERLAWRGCNRHA